MYTPPSNHTRMLFTVKTWTGADGLLQLYAGPEAFAEFYPVTTDEVSALLSEPGWQRMTANDVSTFVTSLHRLFERIGQAQDTE